MIQQQQQTLVKSPYIELYNLIVPRDNMLRQINELVDFSFIYEERLLNKVGSIVGVEPFCGKIRLLNEIHHKGEI
ncbi:hypothetical protein OIN60_06070 [Paenibacillus sp. P96]|uniref:Transposase n=1 Tax=Paenibacillus zeirhizosphaerae TaxID=2987519 RepID=A0ABT9FNM7_9BACL|nr:hypothetical protein [Paenibacillus sp. P96]MDP4096333.1 hypothetical protein [Paenibacillus sp. P96]